MVRGGEAGEVPGEGCPREATLLGFFLILLLGSKAGQVVLQSAIC